MRVSTRKKAVSASAVLAPISGASWRMVESSGPRNQERAAPSTKEIQNTRKLSQPALPSSAGSKAAGAPEIGRCARGLQLGLRLTGALLTRTRWRGVNGRCRAEAGRKLAGGSPSGRGLSIRCADAETTLGCLVA